MHLVPWGEYVPLKDWLTFVGPLVQAIGRGFDAGDTVTLLPVGSHRVSTAICYEIIYPELVRQFVAEGSELLTTITNDSWFGRSSAPYQHFEQASLRAIEEGRYLVRSANTGVSGIVDPYGHVLARTEIFRPAVIVGEVRLLTVRTPYSRVGDVFAYASAMPDRRAAADGPTRAESMTADREPRARVPSQLQLRHAHRRRLDAPLSGSHQASLRSSELSLKPPDPDEELGRLDARAAADDFWKDQAEAQKVLQRRRRLEQDRDLMRVAQEEERRPGRARRVVGVGRVGGRGVRAGARVARPGSAGRRDQEDARRRARSQERDRDDSSRRRRHRVAGLGRDAAPDVPAMDGAPRLQARADRLPARRRSRASRARRSP